MTGPRAPRSLAPYAARLAGNWDRLHPGRDRAEVAGTLISVDLSGFTRLAERLAGAARTGAEELNLVLNAVYSDLVDVVHARGGDVLQFRGDALLILFSGPGHATRAASAAWGMQRALGARPAEATPAGPVRLRMRVGVAGGRFRFAVVGRTHRELMVVGPDASRAVRLESAAAIGRVLVDDATARALRGGTRAAGPGHVLIRAPRGEAGGPSHPPPREAAAFVPGAVRRLVESGAPVGEHRRAAVSFLVLRGTDAPEGARGLGTVAAAIDEAVERLGVTWTATDIADGGAVFLVFAGVPFTMERDEERLVTAVRGILDACPGLPLGAGLNAGPVFAADVGHPDRRTFAAIGDTTNVAARLAYRAGPGELLASREALDRAGGRHALAWRDPLPLKGKRLPMEAAAVGPAVSGYEESRRHDAPLVGREGERAELVALLEGLALGRSSAVVLEAEAGAGKSRLLAEVGAAWTGPALRLAGVPYERATPYAASRAGLRRLLAARGVALTGPALTRAAGSGLAPLLGLPLGVEMDPTPEVARLDVAFVAERRSSLLADLALGVAAGPLLVIAEDLHWCDRSTLGLLDALAERVEAGAPLVLLVTARPPAAPSLASPGRWRIVPLAPLNSEAARTVALAAVSDAAIDDDRLDALLDAAGGNPLYLTELARLARDPGAVLPPSAEEVVAARIDSLAPEHRAQLRDAAVGGGTVPVDVLAAAVGQPALVDVARWRALGEFVAVTGGELSFRHDLVRQAAYAGLPVRRRRALHGGLADALLARHDDIDRAAPLVAMHLHEAQRFAEAWGWAGRAAGAAVRGGALADAGALYARALDAARRAGAPHDRRAELGEALGDVADLLGRYAEAGGALAAAANDGAPGRARARRMVKRAGVLEREGRYAEALRLLTVAERRERPPSALRAELLLRRSSTLHRRGRLRASLRVAREAEEAARTARDPAARARALLRQEMVSSELGLPERAELGRRALAAFARVDAPRDLGHLLLNLGVTAKESDDWDLAVERYRGAEEAYRQAGDRVGRAFAGNNRGEILSDQGRLDEADAAFTDARRVFRAAGLALGVASTASSLSRLRLYRGEHDAARTLLAEALEGFTALGAGSLVLDTRVRQVECALLADGPAAARALAEAVAGEITRFGAIAVLPVTLARLRALASGGDGLEAALADARAQGVLFEVGLCLEGLVARRPTAERRAELAAAWTRLGVVAAPPYPAPRDGDGAGGPEAGRPA